jgi:GT2 family glycosyltransferase
MNQTWSVIVCSIDAAKYAHIVQTYERLLAGRAFEIIGIHDAVSLAEAYNRGIARARGDILVFSHDDILILDDAFASKVEYRLASGFDVLGFAGATKLTDGYWWSAGPDYMRGVVSHAPPGSKHLSLHVYGVSTEPVEAVQGLDGLCLIAHRRAIEKQSFDDQTFDGFHLYDLDFSLSAHLGGLRVGVMSDVAIIHMSAGNFGSAWRRYRERFVIKHAAALGRDAETLLKAPEPLRARVALFDDFIGLRDFWQHDNLRRVSLAMQRTGS